MRHVAVRFTSCFLGSMAVSAKASGNRYRLLSSLGSSAQDIRGSTGRGPVARGDELLPEWSYAKDELSFHSGAAVKGFERADSSAEVVLVTRVTNVSSLLLVLLACWSLRDPARSDHTGGPLSLLLRSLYRLSTQRHAYRVPYLVLSSSRTARHLSSSHDGYLFHDHPLGDLQTQRSSRRLYLQSTESLE